MRVECHPHRGKVVKRIPESVSVRELPNGHVFYTTAVLLGNVSFDVQPAGPERVNRNGVRDVHAFARGTVLTWDNAASPDFFEYTNKHGYSVACYNPFVRDCFFDRDTGDRIDSSWLVLITGGVCYYAL